MYQDKMFITLLCVKIQRISKLHLKYLVKLTKCIFQRVHFSVEGITLQAKDRSLSVAVSLSTGVNLVSFPDKDNK